jgi:predicted Zn-dependent protease
MEPKNQAALEIMGIIKGLQNKPLEATNFFKKGLKIDPNNQGLQFNLAKSYLDGKKYEEALIQHLRLVKNYPQNCEAWLNLGMTQLELQKYSEAISSFNECL